MYESVAAARTTTRKMGGDISKDGEMGPTQLGRTA